MIAHEALALVAGPRAPAARVRGGFLWVERVGVEALGADREQLLPRLLHFRCDSGDPVADGGAAAAAAGLVDEVLFWGGWGAKEREGEGKKRKVMRETKDAQEVEVEVEVEKKGGGGKSPAQRSSGRHRTARP